MLVPATNRYRGYNGHNGANYMFVVFIVYKRKQEAALIHSMRSKVSTLRNCMYIMDTDQQMGKPNVIMISGYLRSGKDVVGKHLCDVHGYVRLAFADLLKQQVSKTFNLNRASLETQSGKDALVCGKTVRSLLIEHAQMRRKQNANYWIESVLSKLEKCGCKRAVITDWRFPNEYVRISEHANVQSWRIDRWGAPPLLDETEIALDSFPFDHRINNTGSVEELCAAVDRLVFPTFLLVDVDGVLLRWVDGFRRYLQARGYTFTTEYPTNCGMAGWVAEPIDINALILSFNRSPDFAALAPYEDAQNALKTLKKRMARCTVVAVSSCDDEKGVVQNRKKNINDHFKGLVDDIICLPLGSSKIETLHNFPPSVWVDDNITNALEGASIGHDAILFSRPWSCNSHFGSVQRVACWDEVIGKI